MGLYENNKYADLHNIYKMLEEKQKELDETIQAMHDAGINLANAKAKYKVALTKTMVQAHNGMLEIDGIQIDDVAWTSCETVAKGVQNVADLRLERDLYKYEYTTLKNKMFNLKSEKQTIENYLDSLRNNGV